MPRVDAIVGARVRPVPSGHAAWPTGVLGSLSLLLLLTAGIARPVWPQQDTLSGERVVRHVFFQGNHAIDDYTLRISIATSQSSWFARAPVFRAIGFLGEKRYFDETEFRRDVLRLQLLYRESGYFEARVDTVVRRGRSDVDVRFVITEGRPVRVTAMSVTGAEAVLPTREILRELPLQVGDPFNRFLLQASADTVRSLLENRGYPFVAVFRSYDEDRRLREARVAFSVDPGGRARVDGVEVEGTDRIAPRVVRRSVAVRPGQYFRRDALYESQRDLYRMDLFSYVNVGLADSVPTGPADSTVTVRVQVTEGRLHRTRAGAGFGALDCFRGLAGWTGRNLGGGGRSLDLTGRVSKIGTGLCPGIASDTVGARRQLNYSLTAALREPFFFSRRTSAAFSLFAERHSEVNAFSRTVRGADLSLTEQTGWDIPATLSYTLAFGTTLADPAIFCTFLNVCRLEDTVFSQSRRESTVGVRITRDRSNSPLDPSRGSVLSVLFRYASRAIGSDPQRQFSKAVLDFVSYHRLGRRGVFAWRVRGGAILPAELATGAKFVPPDERLYAGGPNTVRGYGQNDLGPLVRVIQGFDTIPTPSGVDSIAPRIRTSPTGGHQLILANAELRAPLPGFGGRLHGALFVDAGQVFGGEPPSPDQRIRVTPGAGLRLATPLGPIRLDAAYNPSAPTPGRLYEPVGPTGGYNPAGPELRLVQADYAPPAPTSFWKRLTWHFSVGQAF